MSAIELESIAWGLLYGAVIVATIIAAVRDGYQRSGGGYTPHDGPRKPRPPAGATSGLRVARCVNDIPYTRTEREQ